MTDVQDPVQRESDNSLMGWMVSEGHDDWDVVITEMRSELILAQEAGDHECVADMIRAMAQAERLRDTNPIVPWFFTFGLQYPWGKEYLKVMAPSELSAREYVFECIGNQWAFNYNEADFEPQPAAYGLTEMTKERWDEVQVSIGLHD